MELILPLATCHCTSHCVMILLFIILANKFSLSLSLSVMHLRADCQGPVSAPEPYSRLEYMTHELNTYERTMSVHLSARQSRRNERPETLRPIYHYYIVNNGHPRVVG